MTTSGSRSGLRSAGIVVAIVAVLASLGLWYAAGEREADAVRKLARAPIGCDTTLDFALPGEFLLFVETAGVVDEVPGNCGTGGAFERTNSAVPVPVVSLVDSAGNAVALDSSSGVSYSADGRRGQSIRTFAIETPGDHVVTVESPTGDADFVLAVGRDPSSGVAPLRFGALAAAGIGLILAAMLFLADARRQAALTDEQSTVGWPNAGASPLTPPGMAPPASSWQPVVGPPNAPPSIPIPGEPALPGQAPPPMQPSSPSAAPPSGPVIAGHGSSTGPSPWAPRNPLADGGTGDGERSPWGPPTETST